MEDSAAPKRSVTVADVAKAARVSKATAARVLGGYGVVSGKIKDQVMAAAAALEYRPNELARSMSTGRSGIIGIVVGDIENAFFSLAVRGISDAARLAGFDVIISNSGEKLESEKSAVDLLIGKRVDGLIVTPARCDSFDHLRHVGRAGMPLVLFDRSIAELDVDAVTGNDREAAIAAARFMVDAGHRRLAYVSAMDAEGGGVTDISRISNSAVRERVEGFMSVLTEAGLSDPLHYVRLGATDQPQTDAVIKRLLADPLPPTAVLASDSLVGLRVFKSLQSLGLSIPGDISMISFLDADWTSVTVPPITVVDQRVYEMGKLAGERLVARIEQIPLAVERLRVSTSLVIRSSVARIGG